MTTEGKEPNLWMIYDREPGSTRLRVIGMVFAEGATKDMVKATLPPTVPKTAIVEDFGWIDTVMRIPTYFTIEANT